MIPCNSQVIIKSNPYLGTTGPDLRWCSMKVYFIPTLFSGPQEEMTLRELGHEMPLRSMFNTGISSYATLRLPSHWEAHSIRNVHVKAIILLYATWFSVINSIHNADSPLILVSDSASAWKEQQGDQQGVVSGFSVRNNIVYDFDS